MNARNVLLSLIILIAFYFGTHLSSWFSTTTWPLWVRFCLPYLIWVITIAAFWPFYKHRLLAIIGLQSSPLEGILWACLFVSPMLLGFALTSEIAGLQPMLLVKKALLPGFFEELMFRGFLVGMLISVANWRFLPAACINALLFAY